MSDSDGLHLLRLLEGVQRQVAEELDHALPARARGVGPRRLRILQLIPEGGCSQQELAERALVSKQAVAGLVDGLVEAGLVVRTASRDDGRVRVVRRSKAGDRVSADLDAAMRTVEDRLARRLGRERYGALRASLTALDPDRGT